MKPLFVLAFGLFTATFSGCLTVDSPRVTDTPTPSLPQCQASQARTWHQEFQDADYPAASITFTGTDAGETMNLQLQYDEALGYLMLKDHVNNTLLYSLGQRVIITEAGESIEFRDVGTPNYALRFLADLDTDEPEDPANDWFTTPTSALTHTCASYGGNAAYKLNYNSGTVQEEWVWDTAGNLQYASFTRASTSTDVRVTMQSSAIPIAAPVAQSKGAFITYSIVSESESGQSYYQTIQVEPGTFHSYYAQMRIDLLNGEDLIAELTPANGWSSSEGSVAIEDRGQKGILDDGDILAVTLGPNVDSYYLYDAWSETYFGEDIVDANGDSVQVEPEAGGEVIDRHYEWTFDGSDYYIDLSIPLNVLEYYESTEFTYSADGRHNYAAYVATQYDDEFIQIIADELKRIGTEEGYSDDDSVSMALSFVQSLLYTSDSVTTGFDEFPRYPLESLADEGGDCEDTAILFASIVQAMGYGAILINPPGHMATGVLVDSTFVGTTYNYKGQRWAYAETTGDGWRIGQIPNDYKTANAQLLSLDPQAVVVIDAATVQAKSGGYYPIHIDFANDGTASTVAGRVTVYGMNAARTLYYDSNYCTFTAMEAGASYTCDLSILADNRIAAFQVVLKTNDGYFAIKDF